MCFWQTFKTFDLKRGDFLSFFFSCTLKVYARFIALQVAARKTNLRLLEFIIEAGSEVSINHYVKFQSWLSPRPKCRYIFFPSTHDCHKEICDSHTTHGKTSFFLEIAKFGGQFHEALKKMKRFKFSLSRCHPAHTHTHTFIFGGWYFAG